MILGFHGNTTHLPGRKKHVSILITLLTNLYKTVEYVPIFNYLKITNSQYSIVVIILIINNHNS